MKNRLFVIGLVLLCGGVALSQDMPYSESTTWELTFIRIHPGMSDDYLKGLGATWKKVGDEAKKQGLIVSYKVLTTDAANKDDYNLILMTEYKNKAALDNLDAKMRVIESKIVGNPDAQKSVMTKRIEMRDIIGSKLATEINLK